MRVGILAQRQLSLRTEGEIEMEDILKLIVGEPRRAARFHDLRHAGHHFAPALSGQI